MGDFGAGRGAIGVTFIIANFAPEAKGQGVPEIMDAIYYNGGRIRPIVALAKSLASALAIGSGAAVGREGPILQIGSALGSTLGQLIKMPAGQRITLVAAGAGAGIAATFNTSIVGVMLGIELMPSEVSVNTFLPVAAATGTWTFIGRLACPHPAFSVPPIDALPLAHRALALATLWLYVLLGAICGVAGAPFIKTLHLAEDVLENLPGRYTRHAAGMPLVGGLIYGLHDFVEGGGYSTIHAILNGWSATGWLLALLFVCKLFATSTSLGSGSSGGIFSPSLFMVSTLVRCVRNVCGAVAAGSLRNGWKKSRHHSGLQRILRVGLLSACAAEGPEEAAGAARFGSRSAGDEVHQGQGDCGNLHLRHLILEFRLTRVCVIPCAPAPAQNHHLQGDAR